MSIEGEEEPGDTMKTGDGRGTAAAVKKKPEAFEVEAAPAVKKRGDEEEGRRNLQEIQYLRLEQQKMKRCVVGVVLLLLCITTGLVVVVTGLSSTTAAESSLENGKAVVAGPPTAGPSMSPTCHVGSIGCACTKGGACDYGAHCNADSICAESSPSPTATPSTQPSPAPTTAPTDTPSTQTPTAAPTQAPTTAPTEAPTEAPTPLPTQVPSLQPTRNPTCHIGSLGCSCTPLGKACDGGLVCQADDVCGTAAPSPPTPVAPSIAPTCHVGSQGCSCTALGSACDPGLLCDYMDVCVLEPADCRGLLAIYPNATNGVYQLRPSSGVVSTYCDMGNGGWTLVAKINTYDRLLGSSEYYTATWFQQQTQVQQLASPDMAVNAPPASLGALTVASHSSNITLARFELVNQADPGLKSTFYKRAPPEAMARWFDDDNTPTMVCCLCVMCV